MDMFHSPDVVSDAQRDKVGSKRARYIWSRTTGDIFPPGLNSTRMDIRLALVRALVKCFKEENAQLI